MARRVAIVTGLRTPFARAGTVLQDFSALELAKLVTAELLERSELPAREVQQVVFGIVVPDVQASNIGREVVLGTELPRSTEAYTVSRACASSNQAIVSAAESISSGAIDVAIAGGTESLSNVPLLASKPLARALVAAAKAKSLSARFKAFSKVRLKDVAPVAPAIAELSTGLTMGQSAEKMAKENHISRLAQDRFALESHTKAAAATDDGRLTAEILRAYVPPAYKTSLGEDNGIRRDTSLEALAALPPAFDRLYGTLTAGNSSPLTDGASAVLLMSEEKAKSLGYPPLGFIRAYAFSAVDPFDQLLMGPAYSTPVALDRARLALSDMSLIEFHEAFAAQVLSVIEALESDGFAREKLNRPARVGDVPRDRVNVEGGSIALGHPFAATGARITISLLNELRRRGGGFGLLAVCAAGGLGFSMVVETE